MWLHLLFLGSGQQVFQRRVVQVVDGHDVFQVLRVAHLVSHEVRDSGPRENRQRTQHLHVLERHLEEEKKTVSQRRGHLVDREGSLTLKYMDSSASKLSNGSLIQKNGDKIHNNSSDVYLQYAC